MADRAAMDLGLCLKFAGRCEEAFAFYAQLCGGGIAELTRYGERAGIGPIPSAWSEKVLLARLNIGSMAVLGIDAPPGEAGEPGGFCVTLAVDAPEEAGRIFAQLAEGGEVTLPLGDSPIASRFGMVTDRFGTPWIVLCQPTD